jgi:transketolase
MKQAFTEQLFLEMEQDKRIILITGDLGYNLFDKIKIAFPDRYINVGIMEQTMIGYAAGLAITGKIPVVYSISTFLTMRAFEQIRNDFVLQKLPVVLVGNTHGYEQLGATHNSELDRELMKLLGITILTPRTREQIVNNIRFALRKNNACYLRIGKTYEDTQKAGDEAP